MRFFIALEVPEKDRQQIVQVQQKLKQLIPQAKLTDSQKLHLTIAFIGEQPEEMKNHLIKVMAEAAKDIPSFEVTPAFIDGFPHLHTAHVLWLGVKDEIDKLYLLRHRIKDGLQSLNLSVDERRYVPHIAIAKVDHFRLTKPLEDELEQAAQREFNPILVTSVKLFESIQNEGFYEHNTLAEVELLSSTDNSK